jgi:hypothetical protein
MATSSSKQRSKGRVFRKVEVTLFVIKLPNRAKCQGLLAVFTKPQHAEYVSEAHTSAANTWAPGCPI